VNNDLTNGNTNENLSSNDTIGSNNDTHDSGMQSSHSIINGLPTASVPIPFQRMQTNEQQQQQQQQQQMLLYQQQQQQQA
jgi:hypothetical protein